MRLIPRRRQAAAHPSTPLPTVAAAAAARCAGTTSRGNLCKLPAGPTGYCGVFHTVPAGPRPA